MQSVSDGPEYMRHFHLRVSRILHFQLRVRRGLVDRKMALSEASWKTRDRAEKLFE
jgi:hypothetical protein